MAKAKKQKKKAEEPSALWMTTYTDMVQLILCFFVALFNPEDIDPGQLAAMISAFNNRGPGAQSGGNTLTQGKMADLGNTIMSLPAMEKGRAMGTALRRAVSLFEPEIKSNKVKVTTDERGVIISLASDVFFNPASARLNIEESRDMLFRLQAILNSEEVRNRKVRIEGHTDSEPVDPAGPWEDNWQLSVERSRAVLHFLSDIGVNERRFQVAGFADTMPVSSNYTVQGREYNRRVDIVILDEAHL